MQPTATDRRVAGISQRNGLIFLTILFIALSPFLFMITSPFLTSFLLAIILATLTNPAKNRLSLRLHRPALATFLITFGTVLLFSIVVGLVGIALTKELGSAYDRLSRLSLEEGGWATLLTHTADRIVNKLSTWVPVNKEAIRAGLLATMRSVTGYLFNRVGAAVGGVTSILVTSLLVTLFLYYLLRYGEDWIRRISALIPLEPLTTATLFRTVHQSIIANANGVLVVAVSQGLFLSLGFWFVDLQSPVTWGVVGAFASAVPIFGAPLVWIPFVIGFAFMGMYGKALGLGLWGALVVGSLDNILRPYVVGAGQKQHPVLMAMTMIGGTYAFGPLGILLGPVLVSLTIAVLEEILKLKQQTPATQSGSTEPSSTQNRDMLGKIEL